MINIQSSHLFSKHKQTIGSFFWRLIQIFGKQGVTFFIFIVSANLLSPYDFGVYSYILAIVSFLIIFGDFGISFAVSRHIAGMDQKRGDKVGSVIFNSAIIIFLLTSAVAVAAITFGRLMLEDKYQYMLYALPLVFLLPVSSLYDGIFRGLKKFKELALISLIVGFSSVALAYLLILKFGLIGSIFSQIAFYFILVIVLFFGCDKPVLKINKRIIKQISSYSFIIGLVSISYFLYTKADTLILGHFKYFEEIGYYEIVNKVFDLVKLPFLILSTVLAPNISRYYVQKKFFLLRKKLLAHLIFSFSAGLIISFSLYFAFPILVDLFFNQYFTKETILIFRLLLLILPLQISAIIVSNAHTTPTGNANLSLFGTIPAGILNVILNFVFINQYGFIGVVYSTLICFVFSNVLFISIYLYKINKLSNNNSL